ncbi:MAG: CHAT domain-containing protein [Candidatus Eremiobacteraeota bacterium]|nr:CHAT domain-containing protein [Candidatus Eremiobacteraeota bacterium]
MMLRHPGAGLAIVSIVLSAFVVAPPNARAQSSPPCVDAAHFQHSVNDADDDDIQHSRLEQVLQSYQQARARCANLADRHGEAYALIGIGNVERWLGRVNEALVSLQNAVALLRQSGDKRGEAIALNDVGPVYEELDRYNEALRSHEQALALCEQPENRRCRAYALLGIGNAQGDLGRYDNAVESLQAAQRLFLQLHIGDGANRALINLQNVRNEANAGIQELRTAQADAENRASLFGTTLFVSDDYIATLLALDRQSPGTYVQQAFDVHERRTARAVLKQIADSAAKRFRGISDDELKKEMGAQGAVRAAREHLNEQLAKPSTMTEVGAAERGLRQADANLIEIEAAIAVKSPDYYQLLHPQPVSLNALQHDAQQGGLRPGELLLVYDVLPKQSALWAIDRNHIQLFALPGGDVLTRDVDTFRAHVNGVLRSRLNHLESRAARDLEPSKFPADSYALYKKLIPDAIAGAVKGARSLIIAPSGPLYLLAFETLVTKDPKTTSRNRPNYLIDDIVGGISYVPSATLLTVVRKTARLRTRRDPLLAFADPSYPAPAAKKRGVTTYGAFRFAAQRRPDRDGQRERVALMDIPKLPGTDAEAKAAFAQLGVPSNETNLIEGDRASLQTVLGYSNAGKLERYQYLLFATHAALPNQIVGLDDPAIILAHPERGVENSFLRIADVLGLSLNADFVSLSACDTGVEISPSADGISGLTRAFLYAGTPAISVTLWAVDDDAAPQITPPFFAAMRKGASPAAALRLAKLKMLASSQARFRHPYAWAPSVIFGDGDTNYANR